MITALEACATREWWGTVPVGIWDVVGIEGRSPFRFAQDKSVPDNYFCSVISKLRSFRRTNCYEWRLLLAFHSRGFEFVSVLPADQLGQIRGFPSQGEAEAGHG